jgi:thiamine biosynthesis lipoprotein
MCVHAWKGEWAMKQWRVVMGMPVTIEIAGGDVDPALFERLYSYFEHVEEVFSPFRPTSETSRINSGVLRVEDSSEEMRTVVRLAEKTRIETKGYFDINRDGVFDPVGIVKGWAAYQASEMLRQAGVWDFYIEAGGDIQLSGRNDSGEYWAVGIRDPFAGDQIVKSLRLSDMGIATSGTYVRGHHICDPLAADGTAVDEIVSVTVLGPNVYEADRFATAAFAMGREGIRFLEREPGLEGYMIDRDGMATMTSGFASYVAGPVQAASDDR